MADLNTCPFCGSKAKLDKPSRGAPGWQVFCTRCQAVATNVFDTEEKAVGAWNTRTPTANVKD
jgi:Lar family restriction alleviation protein